MITATLDERVTQIERELLAIRAELASAQSSPRWRDTFGMFANDPGFDEVVQLGREIREAERSQVIG